MRTRDFGRIAICIGIVGVLGCGESTPPAPRELAVTFTRTWKDTYCGCLTMYGKTQGPDSGSFSGNLVFERADFAKLFVGGASHTGLAANGQAEVRNQAWVCGAFVLTYVETATGIAGNWVQQLDCHGLSRGGTFTATD